MAAEQMIARSLRPILKDLEIGAPIGYSASFREVLSGIEWFLPGVIGEVHPEWIGMTLDGIDPWSARKTGESEIEIFGYCIFIDDQTVTPVHLRLQLAARNDEVSWLECRVGEPGPRGMVRTPYSQSVNLLKRIYRKEGVPESLEWVYQVTFGTRRQSI